MKKIIIVFVLFCLSSCANLTKSDSSELLVQYATIKFINTSDDPKSRARKIVEIASAAKSLFDLNKKSIYEIEILIRDQIDWSTLSETDTVLANALIIRVKNEIENAKIDEEKMVSGSKILRWIIDGAYLAGD